MRSFLSRRTVQDADSCDLISFLMLLVAVHGLRMMRTVFGKALCELLCEVFGRSFFSFLHDVSLIWIKDWEPHLGLVRQSAKKTAFLTGVVRQSGWRVSPAEQARKYIFKKPKHKTMRAAEAMPL